MAINPALLNSIISTPLTGNSLLAELASINNTTGITDVVSGPLLVLLDQQSASYQVEISDFGKLLSDLAALQDAASALNTPAALSTSASSSNPSVLTATAGTTTTPGFFSVQVNQVAQPQVLLSAALGSATAPIGSGEATTLTFQFGTPSGGSFVPNPNQPAQNVTIDAGNNSLEGIANAINQANIGVSAFVIHDDAGYHLEVSTVTGTSNGLSITVNGDATLASLFTYNPGGLQAMAQLVAPQDAQFTVNGMPGTSSSNTVTDPATGLTLNLVGTGSATVTASSQGTSVVNQVQAFVTAFNKLNGDLNTIASGDLKGNPLVQQLQTQLRNILASETFNLASAGLTEQPDGSLTLDTAALENTLATSPSSVAVLFSNSGHGLADQLASLGQAYINSTTGLLTTEISTLAHDLTTIQNAEEIAFLQAQAFALSNLLLSLQGTNQLVAAQLGLATGLQGLASLLVLEAENPSLVSLLSSSG